MLLWTPRTEGILRSCICSPSSAVAASTWQQGTPALAPTGHGHRRPPGLPDFRVWTAVRGVRQRVLSQQRQDTVPLLEGLSGAEHCAGLGWDHLQQVQEGVGSPNAMCGWSTWVRTFYAGLLLLLLPMRVFQKQTCITLCTPWNWLSVVFVQETAYFAPQRDICVCQRKICQEERDLRI